MHLGNAHVDFGVFFMHFICCFCLHIGLGQWVSGCPLLLVWSKYNIFNSNYKYNSNLCIWQLLLQLNSSPSPQQRQEPQPLGHGQCLWAKTTAGIVPFPSE